MSDDTILLVEDNPDDQFLIKRAFKHSGLPYSLQMVSDGQAAIDYLSGTPAYADRIVHPLPALVLLDLKLPLRSGLEVLAWIKQQPDLKRLPVVVLTSSKQSIDIQRAYDAGANSYLVKPVSLDGLIEMVNTISPYWLKLNLRPDIS